MAEEEKVLSPMLQAHEHCEQCRICASQPANPFAALGSTGATFGTGGGFNFGVPGAVVKPAAVAADDEGAEGDENDPAVEEECQVGLLRPNPGNCHDLRLRSCSAGRVQARGAA